MINIPDNLITIRRQKDPKRQSAYQFPQKLRKINKVNTNNHKTNQ